MKTIFLTNIPTPYRVSMWNRLQKKMDGENNSFSVQFMNKKEPNRNWVINDEFLFEYRIWEIPLFYIRNIPIRFSFSYCIAAIRNSDHIILGSSWNDLNVIFISILKRLGIIKNKISFWTEANKLTAGALKSSTLKKHIRKLILSSADGISLIPGKMSELTLKEWGISGDIDFFNFPNIPHIKFEQNSDSWTGSSSERPILTIVARLDEKTKGIENFLESIGKNRLKSITLNIIGSGPDLERYKNFVNRNDLSENILFAGELNIDSTINTLKHTDIFVLPSYSDPSPLSLIEAIKIGLPLLISYRCGNHFECLENSRNGYGFDPDNPDQIRSAFDSLIERKNEWGIFSKKSIEISKQYHNTEKSLIALANKLR